MATSKYPLPNFHFSVKWCEDDENASFSEVTGLNVETKVIEYREGLNKELVTYKIPGLKTYPKVTLKRGVMASDNGFFDWWKTAQTGAVERRDVIVSLLNDAHEAVVVWNLKDAWPSKVSFGALSAKGNDVLIEEIQLECEGLTVKRQ